MSTGAPRRARWVRSARVLVPISVLVVGAVVGVAVLGDSSSRRPESRAPGRIVLDSGFESGGIRCRDCGRDGWVVQSTSGRADAVVVGEEFPIRQGGHALRVRASRDDRWDPADPHPRLELSGHAHEFFEQHREYWVGASVFLPDDGSYEFDSQPDTLLQIHGLADDCDAGRRPPPGALKGEGGRWVWHVRWEPERCGERAPVGSELVDMGAQERGRWTDFVMRFVFSHEADGITQIWRDGELVVDRVGTANHYDNDRGPYLKIGFYKPRWLVDPTDVTRRTAYYDAVRVYEGIDGYDRVDPGA